MQGSELEKLILSGIPDAEVIVKGEGDHFEAIVISAQFDGCSLVQQHQLVYGTLGDHFSGALHALALHTYTPETWASQRRIQ